MRYPPSMSQTTTQLKTTPIANWEVANLVLWGIF
jgi:hypothetical protein